MDEDLVVGRVYRIENDRGSFTAKLLRVYGTTRWGAADVEVWEGMDYQTGDVLSVLLPDVKFLPVLRGLDL